MANFLHTGPSDRVADLGSGTGVISVLGQAKTGAAFVGIEQNAALCALARESAAENGQDISFCQMDVLDAPAEFGPGSFTAAVCNPPYFSSGDRSPSGARADARHAKDGTLERFFEAAFQLLKNGGDFYLCYPAEQLCTVFALLREKRLEPKRIEFIMYNNRKVPRLVLIKAKKLAGAGLEYQAFE